MRKNIKLFAWMIICLGCISCGKENSQKDAEDNNEPTEELSIIGGRWKINIGDEYDVRYYSFYEEGVYSYYSTKLLNDQNGIYSL